jgi:hypothetical protein
MKRDLKIVGGKKSATDAGPQGYYQRARIIQNQANRLNPYPSPRGFVVKFKTWEDYENWRSEQKNPRLW